MIGLNLGTGAQNTLNKNPSWENNSGVMLLGLKYKPGEIVIPEFEHAQATFNLLSELDEKYSAKK
jgi:hypothetical protein